MPLFFLSLLIGGGSFWLLRKERQAKAAGKQVANRLRALRALSSNDAANTETTWDWAKNVRPLY
jgi:hypothetical protein